MLDLKETSNIEHCIHTILRHKSHVYVKFHKSQSGLPEKDFLYSKGILLQGLPPTCRSNTDYKCILFNFPP